MGQERSDVFDREGKPPARDDTQQDFEEAKRELQRRAGESEQPKHPDERTSPEYEGKEPSD
ncbi:hypothetical protein JQX13_34980 [Archangium violaceum]|uniref:hypothetical protein n=1 Tax=Archangium violaceum TaxID=83451 RepID=UPI00193C2A17|nr:hypothetical protein [Archangium violaceum]QRK05363.1 hypothetical protein JQX13_34980 [Archangium violaceum]